MIDISDGTVTNVTIVGMGALTRIYAMTFQVRLIVAALNKFIVLAMSHERK